MKIKHDVENSLVYIKLTNKKIQRTRTISNYVFIDYDEEDKLVGVEVIDPHPVLDTPLPPEKPERPEVWQIPEHSDRPIKKDKPNETIKCHSIPVSAKINLTGIIPEKKPRWFKKIWQKIGNAKCLKIPLDGLG